MRPGLSIRIEYRKGQTRTGVGADGKKWARRMHAHYGHIEKTKGTDGDPLDVYIGPEKSYDVVYAITQLKAPEFKKFDEQKFMLGFKDAAAAKSCYLKHYPDPKIFGGMKAMPFEEFEAKAMSDKNHGKKIASDQRRFVEMNLHLLPRGEKVAAAAVMGGPGAAALSAQFSAERGVPSPFVADLGGGGDFTQYPRPRAGGTAVRSRSGSGYGFKLAGDRTSKIEDRLDDVGLTILGAPYAAKGIANVLKNRSGRLGAVGRAADAAHRAMHRHENAMELTGLSLVAPGVIKPMAKGINRVLPKEKATKTAALDDLSVEQLAALEKVAMQYVPDFEYMTEAEKLASLALMLGRAAGTAQAGVGRAAGAVQAGMSRAAGGVKGMVQDFGAARAAAQHASGIRGIQRARDFRVGVSQGAGAVPVTGPARAGVDPARVQRIAEQRQALESYRKSKGLGTSAERAAANRAAAAPAPQAAAPATASVGTARGPAPVAAAPQAPTVGGNARGAGSVPNGYTRPAQVGGANTAPQGVAGEPQSPGLPKWALPAAAGVGGLVAGGLLFGGGNKQAAAEVTLPEKTAALKAAAAVGAAKPGARLNARATAPAAAATGRPAAAPGGAPPLLTGKTIAKAGAIGALGLGLYAGKKTIDTAADLASGHRHIEPAPSPDYTSVVR